MIIGGITNDREAVIELEVIGPNWQDKIEVSKEVVLSNYIFR